MIKTILRGADLERALARQQRWYEQHVAARLQTADAAPHPQATS